MLVVLLILLDLKYCYHYDNDHQPPPPPPCPGKAIRINNVTCLLLFTSCIGKLITGTFQEPKRMRPKVYLPAWTRLRGVPIQNPERPYPSPPKQSAHFLTARGAMGRRCCSATYPSFCTIQKVDVVSFRGSGLVMGEYMIAVESIFADWVYRCTYRCIYLQMHVRIHACLYVYFACFVCIPTHTHTETRRHTHLFIYLFSRWLVEFISTTS